MRDQGIVPDPYVWYAERISSGVQDFEWAINNYTYTDIIVKYAISVANEG